MWSTSAWVISRCVIVRSWASAAAISGSGGPTRVDQHARASGGVPDQIGVGQPAGVHRALDDQDLAARLAALAARLPAWYSASASAESTSPSVGCVGTTSA